MGAFTSEHDFEHSPWARGGADVTFLHLRLRSGEPCYVRAEHVSLIERERITLLGGQVLDVGRESVLRLFGLLSESVRRDAGQMPLAQEEDYWQ
jgi:hypothetical protein